MENKNKAPLVIKATCAGCGMMAGADCQRCCEYIFGRADITETLPITFNEDHQFSLSISVVIEGRNFGKRRAKMFTFNSVRCAELFLMAQGHCKGSKAVIGNGERLLAYLSPESTIKLCANPNCINMRSRKRAPASGKTKYCSKTCGACARAVAKRVELAGLPSQTLMDIG